MLRTFSHTRSSALSKRILGVVVFTLLMVVAARIKVQMGFVPFTMQTFAALLAGLVLGARDGFYSQLSYLSLIALNIPVDTNMLGLAAFAGPTAGFLAGFPLAALTAGYFAEHGANNVLLRWLAGVAGVVVLFLLGVSWFSLYQGGGWLAAWAAVGAPFIAIDLFKAALAAALAEGGRALVLRTR